MCFFLQKYALCLFAFMHHIQNLPQICFQSVYIWSLQGGNNAIAISSIVFSVISVIVSILSLLMEKVIYYTQNHEIIKMNVTGNCIVTKSDICVTRKKALRKALAILMGIEENNMEIMKPRYIKTGLALTIHVYVNEAIDCKQKFVDTNNNNELGDIFKWSWNLSDAPNISDIHSIIDISKQQRVNSELEVSNNLQMTQNQNNNTNDTKSK